MKRLLNISVLFVLLLVGNGPTVVTAQPTGCPAVGQTADGSRDPSRFTHTRLLEGVFSITATDGETRRFRPGDVFRVEDTPPCKGHITVVGDKSGFFMFAR